MSMIDTPKADIFVESQRAPNAGALSGADLQSIGAGESAGPRPLTAGQIFWAIFGALWAFSASVALLYFLFKAFNGGS
jgi:hypothetical protein